MKRDDIIFWVIMLVMLCGIIVGMYCGIYCAHTDRMIKMRKLEVVETVGHDAYDLGNKIVGLWESPEAESKDGLNG